MKGNGYHFDKKLISKREKLQFSSIIFKMGMSQYVGKTITPTMHLGGSGLGGNGSSSFITRAEKICPSAYVLETKFWFYDGLLLQTQTRHLQLKSARRLGSH